MIDPAKLTGEALARYNAKMEVKHEGPCSSPYYKDDHCPCKWDCPLHGRCCDCLHFHIEKRKQAGVVTEDTNWMVACVKLAQEGKFDEVYVNKNCEGCEGACGGQA